MALEAIRNLAITNLLVGYGEDVGPCVQEALRATPEDQVRRIEGLEWVLHKIDPEKYRFRRRGPPWQQEAGSDAE